MELFVKYHGGAHRDSEAQATYMKEALNQIFTRTIASLSAEELIEDRYNKFKNIGNSPSNRNASNRDAFFLYLHSCISYEL